MFYYSILHQSKHLFTLNCYNRRCNNSSRQAFIKRRIQPCLQVSRLPWAIGKTGKEETWYGYINCKLSDKSGKYNILYGRLRSVLLSYVDIFVEVI